MTILIGSILIVFAAALDLRTGAAQGLSLGRLLSQRLRVFGGRGQNYGTADSERRIIAVPREPAVAANDDSFLMGLALDEARSAAERGEVPIGAVVVRSVVCPSVHPRSPQNGEVPQSSTPTTYYEVLSSASNNVETSHDASAHAELLSLRSAAAATSNWRLINCTLYSTLEPCPMCLSAAQAFRVDKVVYGAPDLRLGAVESYMTMLEHSHPYHGGMEVEGGIRGGESADMMREFFRRRRRERQEEKRRERELANADKPDCPNEQDRWRYLSVLGLWMRRVIRPVRFR